MLWTRMAAFERIELRLWSTAGRAAVAMGPPPTTRRSSLPLRQLYARNQIFSVTYTA